MLPLIKYIFKTCPWIFPPVIKNIYLKKKYIVPYKKENPPSFIWLETTNACNLNCVMCPTQRTKIKKYNPDSFLNENLFRRLVDEIASENPNVNLFLHKDGEPLLHPNIIDLIDYASSKINNVILSTNATLLDKNMTKAILATGLQDIRFSIDGSKQTFNKIRIQFKDNPYASPSIPIDYDSVVANVLHFCEMRKEFKKNIRIGVRVTDFEPIKKELKNYKSFWKKHVDYIEIAEFLSWGGEIFNKDETSTRYPCLYLWNSITVTAKGFLVPCCVYIDTTGEGKGILADLNSPDLSLKKAFYKLEAIKQIRRAHMNNDLKEVAPFCIQCNDWKMPQGNYIWTKKMKQQLRP